MGISDLDMIFALSRGVFIVKKEKVLKSSNTLRSNNLYVVVNAVDSAGSEKYD